MPLLFPCPAPGTALSFFSCYLIVPKRVTNAAFAAAECLCHFRLICVRMFIHIHFQFFWIDLSEIPMQLILFQITPFFQPLFPFPYGRYRYFEYLMCFFQCMPCLPISYCPFPVFSRITHAFILSLLLLVFNRDYYRYSCHPEYSRSFLPREPCGLPSPLFRQGADVALLHLQVH